MESHRIFAVGDIHGCRQKLEKLLDKMDWRPENSEELVFLGDYIDRGPDSFGVVEIVRSLKEDYPDAVTALKGNHEQMFVNFITGAEDISLDHNGTADTMKSYDRNSPFPASHFRFYLNLELYYETESHIFVHAGLRPGVPLARQSEEDCLWIRNEFLESEFDFGKTVVFGHTPFREPLILPGRAGLDTGAVFGGPLTCMELLSGRLITV
ncbi:MAG: serine/threonine protein phosphatase [Deltaproteobacteria bacterium]|nr:serine/threonine protein phosphatase [Deltaproteobacteria bacterium]